MLYVSTTIVVGYYFERWRPLAIGIAVCGAGVGSVSLPPIMYHIVNSLDWRKSYLIMGALTLICIGTTSTYQPLAPIDLTTIVKASEIKSENSLVEEGESSKKETWEEAGVSFEKNPKLCGEGVSFERNGKVQKDFCIEAGVSFDQNKYSTVTLYLPLKLPRLVSSETIISSATEKESNYIKPLKLDFKNSRFTDSHLSTVQEEDFNTKRSLFCCFCCTRRRYRRKLQIKETYWSRAKKLFLGRQRTHMRPMYRDDIFYSGSLVNLPEYAKSSSKSTSTKQSVS